MAKTRSVPDVLVLGSHPCCYLAAALLHGEKIAAMQASIPGASFPDRLVLINPKFFELNKFTAGVKKTPGLTPIHGLKFVGDDGATTSEYIAKSIVGYIAGFQNVRAALVDQAKRAKVELHETRTLEIRGANENGVDLSLDGVAMRPKMLIVGGELSVQQRKTLGLPESWDAGVMHRYTYLRLKGDKWADAPATQLMPMSLDLSGKLLWAWMMAGEDGVQIAVDQPVDSVQKHPPAQLLAHWIDVLAKYRLLKTIPKPAELSAAVSIDLPLAGALAQEGVANRTLLIGPAGGFYNACAEDIYPTCWSALFAVDVAVKALQVRHLQDALGAYRETWGSTLGDYLRGPQENLRFLLPLVYRNAVMTARMGEAILAGESVVR